MAAVGRAFKIRKKQVDGYGYARPRRAGRRLTRNPGVTAIAAINGRGAYRSARSSMRGVSTRRARLGRARKQLSENQKRAFVSKMRAAKHRRNAGGRRLPLRRRARSLSANPRRLGRKRGRSVGAKKRVLIAKKVSRPVKRRRRKSRKAQSGRKSMRRIKRKASRRRKTLVRNRTASRRRRKVVAKAAAPKRRRRRAKVKAVAPKRRRVRRRRKVAAKAVAPKRRRRRRKLRRNSWKGNSQGHARAARKGWRGRRAKAAAPKRRRSRRRRASTRRAASRRTYKSNRRRHLRRNRRPMRANSRRRVSRKRRSLRRNGRRAFRRNEGLATTFMTGLKLGAIAFGGFGLQKLGSWLVSEQLLARIIGKPEAAQPAATSGLEALQPYRGLIGSAVMFPIGAFIANKAIKDNSVKLSVITGMGVAVLHNVAVALLNKVQPSAAAMLSGYEDSTAARLSAMYGFGDSIMPRYAPISGYGEYFTNPTNGLGEYFTNPVNGLGEYFTNPVSGLGVAPYEASAGYGQNPDLFQAAAGMGAVETRNTNHIDPSGDLERQLDIVEAAAGVGVAPYEASAGLGASIVRVPTANTWIPGTTDGSLWAGVRPINQSQAADETVPAGILQTDGGQGVFG